MELEVNMSDAKLKELQQRLVDVRVEIEKTKARIAEAQEKSDAVVAKSSLDDAAGVAEFTRHQFIITAGPAKLRNLEAQEVALLREIDDEAKNLSNEKGKALEAVKLARFETFRRAVVGFLPADKVESVLPFWWKATTACTEIEQVESNLSGLNQFHSVPPLIRASRVLAVQVPIK